MKTWKAKNKLIIGLNLLNTIEIQRSVFLIQENTAGAFIYGIWFWKNYGERSMAEENALIIQKVRSLITALEQAGIHVQEAYLFGSYA